MPQRYEREIDELLRRMEGRARRGSLSRRLTGQAARLGEALEQTWRSFLRRSPVEQFFLASVVLTLLALPLRTLSPAAAFYVGVSAVVLLVLAIVISVATHRAGGLRQERRWRGRPLDTPRSVPAWWLHLRQWWRRRQR